MKKRKVISIDGKLAEKYRLKQAEALMLIFEKHQGRSPETVEELTSFVQGHKAEVERDKPWAMEVVQGKGRLSE